MGRIESGLVYWLDMARKGGALACAVGEQKLELNYDSDMK